MVAPRGVFSGILLAAVSQFALHNACAAGGDAVIKWNDNAGTAAIKACMNADSNNDPFHESRIYAMMHIAIHDALNAIDRKYQPYAYDKKAAPGTSADAAIATAAHDVLDKGIAGLPAYIFKADCINAGRASVEATYKAAIDAIPDTHAKQPQRSLQSEPATIQTDSSSTRIAPSLSPEDINARRVPHLSPLRPGKRSPRSRSRIRHSSARVRPTPSLTRNSLMM